MPTTDDRPAGLRPEKPFTEMTREELRAFQRTLNREIRDHKVAAGRCQPRTSREFEIWRTANAKREATREARLRRLGSSEDGAEKDAPS